MWSAGKSDSASSNVSNGSSAPTFPLASAPRSSRCSRTARSRSSACSRVLSVADANHSNRVGSSGVTTKNPRQPPESAREWNQAAPPRRVPVDRRRSGGASASDPVNQTFALLLLSMQNRSARPSHRLLRVSVKATDSPDRLPASPPVEALFLGKKGVARLGRGYASQEAGGFVNGGPGRPRVRNGEPGRVWIGLRG